MQNTRPYLGIIEGFFGRTWSMQERHDYAGFLQANGYHFYIYAPKGDALLRRSWRQDCPAEAVEQIQALVNHYHSLGLDFGVGLSPFEVYKNYDNAARKLLQGKVERLNRLGIDILCVLFDDMQGNQPDLAQTQAAIVKDVLAQTSAKKVIMCPTYYSFDPKLEKLFGVMPNNYFQDLGRELPEQVDIFWTGPKICSTAYPQAHMEKTIEVLGRKPFLWDNYPVNDGADISRFLYTKAFENRPDSLAQLTTGHAVNPMNQPWLSRIPLYSLPLSYSQGQHYDPEKALQEGLTMLCEENLARQIAKDVECFQNEGLDNIDTMQSKQLIEQYSRYDSPYAKEIIAWLKGEYAFDKECLTG